MVARYGLSEVESWVWVLYNEPGGINAYSKQWESGGFSYTEMFFNTSAAIKSHSKAITVGGLSDSSDMATELAAMIKADPTHRSGLMDLFTFHHYCNGMNSTDCGAANVAIVKRLRTVLPVGMPVVLEETGSTAGPYDEFHDTTAEAAFVVPCVD